MAKSINAVNKGIFRFLNHSEIVLIMNNASVVLLFLSIIYIGPTMISVFLIYQQLGMEASHTVNVNSTCFFYAYTKLSRLYRELPLSHNALHLRSDATKGLRVHKSRIATLLNT